VKEDIVLFRCFLSLFLIILDDWGLELSDVFLTIYEEFLEILSFNVKFDWFCKPL